jgi:Holliday junction resolvasome RuvABC ATP-dependent DNA helicase subunit
MKNLREEVKRASGKKKHDQIMSLSDVEPTDVLFVLPQRVIDTLEDIVCSALEEWDISKDDQKNLLLFLKYIEGD